MIEWLQWFDARMKAQGKKVLLLIDNMNRQRQRGSIFKVSNIREYISPYAERVHDDTLLSSNDLVDEIVANHSLAEEEELEFEEAQPPTITHNETLQALHVLRCYKEENVTDSDSDRIFLRNLQAEERDIISKHHSSKIQCTLESFFTPRNTEALRL
jgi:hypothetical protein